MFPESARMANIESIEYQNLEIRARDFAKKCHEGQFRKSGEPYFIHCEAVAKIIKDEWKIDNPIYIAAAYLHDTIEDANVTAEELEEKFGHEVTELVVGVTKLKSSENKNTDRETVKKVLDKSYMNPGVAVEKLADRLHNMRTLEYMPENKQISKSRETLEAYTRLAESLGMWIVKQELEDIAFHYIDRCKYQKTKEIINNDPRWDENFLSFVESDLNQTMDEFGFGNADISIKKNNYYNLVEKSQKMSIMGECLPNDFKQVNDLVSFRICLNNVRDCYTTVNLIHEKYGNMVDFDRFDEFMGANKRLNGYSAIQTTINFPQGPAEIAITTKELEEFNDWGVVSLIRKGDTNLKDYVLKLVFTPFGTVRFLPKAATGIDFAYAVNPRLGTDIEAIKVDGVCMAPTTVIPNSSSVEVIAGNSRRAPKSEFLNYCLPSTRKIMTEQIKQADRNKLSDRGTEIMEKVLSQRGLLTISDLDDSNEGKINQILFYFGCQQVSDLYFKLGGGYITEERLASELDSLGITKEGLGLSTIRATGLDKPGILNDLSREISLLGRNIINTEMKKNKDKFNIRLVVKGMTSEEEKILREFIENDYRFDTCTVV
jgi:GTP pyrophosphokinase